MQGEERARVLGKKGKTFLKEVQEVREEKEEVTSQRCQRPACVGNCGLGREHSIFSECYQEALDHFLAKKSHNLTCVLYESLKNLFSLGPKNSTFKHLPGKNV